MTLTGAVTLQCLHAGAEPCLPPQHHHPACQGFLLSLSLVAGQTTLQLYRETLAFPFPIASLSLSLSCVTDVYGLCADVSQPATQEEEAPKPQGGGCRRRAGCQGRPGASGPIRPPRNLCSNGTVIMSSLLWRYEATAGRQRVSMCSASWDGRPLPGRPGSRRVRSALCTARLAHMCVYFLRC